MEAMMVEEVLERLYRIEVPLPNSPLKELNSYVIKGEGRDLVIDTGFNRTACYEAMREGLASLKCDSARTDFLITHMHSDHSGLVGRLASEASRVYFSRGDAWVFDKDRSVQPMIDYARRNGFPADELTSALASHPGFKYKPERIPALTLIDDGHLLAIGGYRLRALGTPGHTRGHLCLYDAERRVLFSGDHVLFNITPHIESWSYQVDSLRDYLGSLTKVYGLPVEIVLPGHRSLFRDLKGRIDALREHHRERAEELLGVLGAETLSAYEIAGRMSWDIDCASWEVFPVAQKWFATGEALAHLRYLEGEGQIRRSAGEGGFTFSAAGG
ncbi:MAG: MBL fold metallo-hydrolase [Syntrophales bacterium]